MIKNEDINAEITNKSLYSYHSMFCSSLVVFQTQDFEHRDRLGYVFRMLGNERKQHTETRGSLQDSKAKVNSIGH